MPSVLQSRHVRSHPFLLLALLVLTSCEKPFEPLAPSDLAFSIYGHLDAGADTQWVRVMPIRASLETQPGPIDAVVTLEEVETGEQVVMSDSLLRYNSVSGVEPFYARNFSATMPLVPGRHYRLVATRSDGVTASATVLIPIFQDPTLEVTSRPGSLPVGSIRGTRYLAMVLSRQDIPEICNWPIPVHQEFLRIPRPATSEGGSHEALLAWPLNPGSRPSYVPTPPNTCPPGTHFTPKRILAIASSEPWPYGATAELRLLTHPATVSNVDGGVGFVAGVHTRVFPFDECTPVQGSSTCSITFSPRSATLVGLVTNGCTGGPLPDMRVELVGPPVNGTRLERTDLSGVFEFHGMEPGAAHFLTLSGETAPGDFFPVELDNVILEEAAVDTISIEMIHRRDCNS